MILLLYIRPEDSNEWDKLKQNFKQSIKSRITRTQTLYWEWKLTEVINQWGSLKNYKSQNTETICYGKLQINEHPSETSKLAQSDCPTTQEETIEMKQLPYESLVGSILYLSLCTRPDISFSVNQVSRFMKNPAKELGCL